MEDVTYVTCFCWNLVHKKNRKKNTSVGFLISVQEVQRTLNLIWQARIFFSFEEATVHFSIYVLQFLKLPLDKRFLLWLFISHVIK